MTVVESYEVDPPKGVKPLNWRLLTSLAVDDEADAREIIHIYRQRWRIEEVFRALKSTGLRLEETQVEAAHRLFKLAALGIAAAVRIIQLGRSDVAAPAGWRPAARWSMLATPAPARPKTSSMRPSSPPWL